MNTDEIRHFLTVLDRGSISRAAEELYISPQGLSQSLKRFEQKLGVRLFVRTPQGVIPTDRAKDLEPMCRAISNAESDIFEYLSELKSANRARYCLGRDSMLGDVVREGVDAYNAAHPDTPVELVLMRESEEQQAKIFLEGGYDFRFLSSETNPLHDLPQEHLCDLPFVPLISRRTLEKLGTFDLSSLSQMTVLAEYNSFTWVRILEQICRADGIDFKVREVDKDYIARLLLTRDDTVTYVRLIDVSTPPWNSDEFVAVREMALTSKLVLQSVHGDVDQELVRAIRNRLENSEYAERP